MASPAGGPLALQQCLKLTTIDLVGGIKCHLCQLIFGNKKDFDSHYSNHSTGNSIVYTCVACLKQIAGYPAFRNHCYLMHVTKNKFKCETCSRMFSKFSALQSHIDALHNFACSSCKKQFPSKKELQLHQITHKNYESPPYKCLSCSKQIENVDSCELHIEEHCTLTYSCPVCNEEMGKNTTDHLIKHFGEISEEHISEVGGPEIPDDSSIDLIGGILCCYCGGIYKNRIEFDTHFTEQHSDKEIVYSCNICGKQYQRYLTFGDHCYYHFSKDRFECEDCDKTFSRLSLLVLHTEAFHSGAAVAKPFQCPICTHGFKSEPRLREHLRDAHATHYVVCPEPRCGMTFKTPKDLIYHQRVHKAGIRCRQCGLQLPSLAACERHLSVHKKKLFSCPVCGKKYAEKYLIMKHVPQHFSGVLHLCKVCGKIYNAKNRLVQHIKTHSEVRDHKCGYCGKGFVKAAQLEQHLNIHTGLKPFKCSECPKSFASYPNWAKHLRRMHTIANPKTTDKQTVKLHTEEAPPSDTVTFSDEAMSDNNNVYKSEAYMDSTSSEASVGALGLALEEAAAPSDVEYFSPLPEHNVTLVSESCGGVGGGALELGSEWPPREYGPDFGVTDLDERALAHIDPRLTVKCGGREPAPAAFDAKWEPLITKVYSDYAFGRDLALDADIF